MKLKGINKFEQHVEKIVLGVVVAILLVVLVVQFLGQRNVVNVSVGGREQQLEPARAYEPIAEEARRLLAAMNDPNPRIPEAPQLGLAQAWESRIEGPRVPVTEVAALTRASGPGAGGAAGDFPPLPEGDYRFPELELPTPSRPMAVSFRSTIDPAFVAANPDVRELVGREQPFDKAAISIEAVFDGRRLREILETDPDGDGSQFAPLPPQWWSNNVEILAVEVERARGLDASGEPIDPAAVGQLPGHEPLVSEELLTSMRLDDLDYLVGEARDDARRIRQPRYLPVIAGPSWMSPRDVARLDEVRAERDEITRLVRRVQQQDDEIARVREQLAQAGQPQRADPGAHGGHGQPQPTRAPSADPQVRRLEQRIEQLERERSRFVAQLRTLGADETGQAIVGEDDDDPFLDDLLQSEEIRLIAHDVEVEPGERYVYRIRVAVNNPLFGRGQDLLDDQRSLAARPLVWSEWSSWSEPVEVERDQYYFLTSATENSPLGGPRATAEVFTFYYGYWRRGTTSLQPGDPVVAEANLPDPNLLPIFDLEAMEVAAAERRSQQRQQPAGHDPHGMPVQVSGPTRRGGGQPTAQEGAGLPEGARAGPERLRVEVEAVLLDVASQPGAVASAGSRRSGQPALQALLRSEDGRLVARNPATESRSVLYARLAESAEEGRRQGLPEPEPVEEERRERRQPDTRERERTPPPPPPPSGGGGGG